MRNLMYLGCATLIICFTLISCKDDSTSSDRTFVEITNAAGTLLELNECSFDSEAPGSNFLFEISFDASSDVEIDGVEFDLSFVNGATFNNIFFDDFDMTNGGLEFEYCFRFEGTDGFELDLKILANNESLESNEVTISIDRPEGANKFIQ